MSRPSDAAPRLLELSDMVRHSDPPEVSEIPATSSAVPDDVIETPPPTKRLSSVDLARALAAMDPDEEITVDVPSPPIPSGVRSPLGDDEEVESALRALDSADDVRRWGTDETSTLQFLGVDLAAEVPRAFDGAAVAPSSGRDRSEDSDAVRARRAVIGSWLLAATAFAAGAYLFATAEPRPASTTPVAVDVAPRP